MPSMNDLYLDLEGDPFVQGGGLEYLFGIGWVDASGRFQFKAFWGHDDAGERAAFESAIDFIVDRRRADPDLHVYHYAAYERTAFGRLMGKYGTREDAVDDNLRVGGHTNARAIGARLDHVYGLFPVLAERRRRTAGYLSGGEQQMLAMGRALMARPRYLLLDEPSLGLAPRLVEQVEREVFARYHGREPDEAEAASLVRQASKRVALAFVVAETASWDHRKL